LARRTVVFAAACLVIGMWLLPGASRAEGPFIDSVKVSDRVIEIYWQKIDPETSAVFGGYKIWRAQGTPDSSNFALLQKYSIREPVGWGFSSLDPVRKFVDPDSLFAIVESLYVDPNDPRLEADPPCRPRCDSISVKVRQRPWDDYRRLARWGPFNGVPYYYSVTCYDAVFDSSTNQVTEVDRSSIRAGTWRGRAARTDTLAPPQPIFCFPVVQQNLGDVTVVPNPYAISAPWDLPGNRKIGFMNLPLKATVRIYTVTGDYVATIEHDASLSSGTPYEGAAFWDLHSEAGKEVVPGIYIYYVVDNISGEEKRGHFVIVK